MSKGKKTKTTKKSYIESVKSELKKVKWPDKIYNIYIMFYYIICIILFWN